MKLEVYHKSNMLQIVLLPQRDDMFRGIDTMQCRTSHTDIETLHFFLQKALEDIYDCYDGWDIADDEGREEVFKHGLWTVRLSSGWAVLTHHHRVINLYMGGQALTMNAYDVERLMVELEKLK